MKRFMKLLWAVAISLIVGVTAVEAASALTGKHPNLTAVSIKK